MNAASPQPFTKYIAIAIAAVAIAFLLVSNNLFAGTPPTNIGVNNGRLAACPSTPNCVNSQAPASNAQYAIAPLQFSGDLPTSMAKLTQIVQALPRTKIVNQTNNYIYAEFTSQLMKFVDDVEFYLDNDTKTIQVRSASRLGDSDLGANRQRIEAIRSKLAA
jgi:uncharacterized protein (DUF1499 family)